MSFEIKPAIEPGSRFGRLTTVKRVANFKGGHVAWLCICDCGNSTIKRGSYLLSMPYEHSCGCHRSAPGLRHGHARIGHETRAYRKWRAMHSRCSPTWIHKEDYFDRGIRVCERWNSFENFYADMGDPPPNCELDREHNDGDYEPLNCRWVSRLVNQRNRRVSINLTFNGKTKALIDWAKETGIRYVTLMYRWKMKWSPERILSRPGSNYGLKKTD